MQLSAGVKTLPHLLVLCENFFQQKDLGRLEFNCCMTTGNLLCPHSNTCHTCGSWSVMLYTMCFCMCGGVLASSCILLMACSNWSALFSSFAWAKVVCHVLIGFCQHSCRCNCLVILMWLGMDCATQPGVNCCRCCRT